MSTDEPKPNWMRRFLLAIAFMALSFLSILPACAQSNQTVVAGGSTTAVNFTGSGCTYNWVNSNPAIGLAASGTGNISSFTAANTGNTPITATITANPISEAYIANDGSNSVTVINTANNTILTTISVGSAPNSIAASPDGSRVYVANEGQTVSVINTSTHKVIATIPVGAYPTGIVVSPDGNRVYVVNNNSADVSVINTTTNTVISTISIGGGIFGIAISPDGKTLYVTNEVQNNLVVISTATNTITATITEDLGSDSEGVAVSPDGKLVYVASNTSSLLLVINAANNQIISKIPIGFAPVGVSVSPDGSRVYVATGNTVSVVNALTNTLITKIPVGSGPQGISISPDGSQVYVANSNNNNVSVINTSTNTVTATINVGNFPISIGNFVTGESGCPPVTFTITVNPTSTPAVITANPATGTITACVGTASASPNIQQFTFSGSDLSAPVVVNAPIGFQVSLTPGSGYGNSLTIDQSSANLSTITVYVRSAANDPDGPLSGNVTLNSTSAANQTVLVSGTVNALPTVNTVANQTVNNGSKTAAVSFTGTGTTFSWTNDTPGIGLAASGVGNIGSFTAVNNGSLPITAKITATPVSEGYAYIANSGDGTISIINVATNQVVSKIRPPHDPFCVCISPDGSKAYIGCSEGSSTVTIINTATNAIISTIPVSSSGETTGITVSPDGTRLYVANYLTSTVSVVNSATGAIIAVIPVGVSVYGLAISPDGSKVYIANGLVINTVNNTIAGNITSGLGAPTGVAVGPDGSIYIPILNGNSNNIYVFDPVNNSVKAVIPLSGAPGLIALSPDATRAYVVIGTNSIDVVNIPAKTVIATIPTGSDTNGISASPDGHFVYAANTTSNDVTVINTSTNTVVTNVQVGISPISLSNFISPGTGCSGPSTTFTITVNPSATSSAINASPATGTISACVGTASASPNIQQFTVAGANPVAGITATAPTGFEVSLSPASGYGNSVTIYGSLAASNTPPINTVYVRSTAGDPVGPISGNVVVSESGYASQNVAVSGVVNALPTVNTVPDQTVAAGTSVTAVNFTGTGNIFTWTNDTPGIGLAASGTGNIDPFTAINTGSTPVTAKITVTPTPKQGFAYITNSTDNTVSVINLSTNTVVATLPAGVYPTDVAISPDGSLAYILNFASQNITVINTQTNTVTATITTSLPLTSLIISADGSKLYVANGGNSVAGSILVISTATNSIIATIPTASWQPSGILFSPDGSRMYVENRDIAPNTNSSLSVFNTADNTITATVPLGAYPSGLAITPNGSLIYVENEFSNNVTVINALTNTVVTTIPVGKDPYSLAISPDGNTVYVTNNNSNNISVISTATNAVTSTITTPANGGPAGISLSPNGLFLYVVNSALNNVSVIEIASQKIIATIPVGQGATSQGNFITGSISCPGIPTTFTITVNPASVPTITAGRVTGDITGCYGSVSDVRQFTVSATGLTADITATAPPDFEISLSPTSGFSSTLTVPQTKGTVNNTIIYVRTTATAYAGNQYQNVDLASKGATTQEVIVSYTIYAIPSADAVISQTVINGSATAPVNFNGTASTYNWVNNTPGIGLASSGIGNIPVFTAINNTANPIVATITATPVNGLDCSGTPIIFTITVNPTALPATLTVTANLSPLNTIYGTPSSAESFTVSGANITNGVSISISPFFEVSNNGSTYSSTTTINSSGTITSAPVYIRLAATTPVGSYTGGVELSTSNANSVNLLIPLSTVSPAPLIITADNTSRPFGAVNPPLTVTYSGFVNNDSPAQLTSQPVVSTTALTQSPVGQYPIIANDAASPNYNFTYVPGVLTIQPSISALDIPNTFTPNGDGINDTWQIKYLEYYPKSTVNIFDRWGQKVFSSTGYPIPWDGTYKGTVLPAGTYYYIIDPKTGQPIFSGWLAIIK